MTYESQYSQGRITKGLDGAEALGPEQWLVVEERKSRRRLIVQCLLYFSQKVVSNAMSLYSFNLELQVSFNNFSFTGVHK